jgi:hypothetical protein
MSHIEPTLDITSDNNSIISEKASIDECRLRPSLVVLSQKLKLGCEKYFLQEMMLHLSKANLYSPFSEKKRRERRGF